LIDCKYIILEFIKNKLLAMISKKLQNADISKPIDKPIIVVNPN